MRIFIVGLPGSGKSTIGKTLSLKTGYRFLDTDELIISKENQSIEDIFKNKGEDYFRKCEQQSLQEAIAGDNSVISTGGGLPCFFENMQVINNSGISIFLNVPPATIANRLWTTENQHRPLIKGKSKEQLLEFLYAKLGERLPFYKQSKLEFAGDTISADEILTKLRSEKLI